MDAGGNLRLIEQLDRSPAPAHGIFAIALKIGGYGDVPDDAARPLARGFGVETAMTIDLKRKGLRITEVEVPLAHRATGTDLRAQLHRARQFADVAWALATRR